MAAMSEAPPAQDVLSLFHAPVRQWFKKAFPAPSRPQQLGWPAIHRGDTTLILAPTGSGKTLTSFLVAIDRVMFGPRPPEKQRCRVLYISPLKALAVDVERNLTAPLAGVAAEAEEMGMEAHWPSIAIRTGDTPGKERAAFLRHPADILITTPESLYLMLTSAAKEVLRSVECVIVDEVHVMAGGKRGVHLSLSLERLEEIVEKPLQRIGLSATQRPLEEVARFLGGFQWVDDKLVERPVTIIDAGRVRDLALTVKLPAESLARLAENDAYQPPSGTPGAITGIWSSIPPVILDLIRQNRATLIFVNSRRLAERLAAMLNDLAGEELVQAHHGSLAREQRLQIEEALKSGRLPGMVATSSLELGIDMGAIDLVIQVGAPPSISGGMQRVGRAGHRIGEPSTGVILPRFRSDLLACAALTSQMLAGQVEEMHYPRNPLDVLAQQIVAMTAAQDWRLEELASVVRRAAPFAELPDTMLHEVLDMLSGKYPAADFAELKPRITWDRWTGILSSRQGARSLAITNAGVIADRGLYPVFLAGYDGKRGSGRVGELDEEMVHETRVGEVILLGASSWRVEEITPHKVLVTPAPGAAGKTPFWHGDSVGRPLEFGRAIGALSRTVTQLDRPDALNLLTTKHCLEPAAAETLLDYLNDQIEISGAIPDDRTVVVEYSRDELGDWRICILSPLGAQVLAPWAMAIAAVIHARRDVDTDVLWADDGIIIRYPNVDEPPPVSWFMPSPEEVEELVVRQLGYGGAGARQNAFVGGNTLFAGKFREAAGRSLLLPRRYPGHRSPLWQTRKRANDLLQAASAYPGFPIVLETYREILKDVFDMPALTTLLEEIESGHIRLVPVSLQRPSPFASALVFSYVGNFMYEYDSPLAERRAMALQIDMTQLRELMGDADLRSLLDEEALTELEERLQHLSLERRAKHADGVHDLLLHLGDLSALEIQERTEGDASTIIEALLNARRIVPVAIAGEMRWIAYEDVETYERALNIAIPEGFEAGQQTTPARKDRDELSELIARYARTHGPFTSRDLANRFGIGTGVVHTTCSRLAATGRITEGEFRPGHTGREWCDTEVLTAWRRRSLARSRSEIEPASAEALVRMSVSWHGLTPETRRHSLIEVIEQLQGAPLHASVLESQILPARLPDYSPSDLDNLMASGDVVWMGVESIGQRDGRIRLALAEDAPLLLQSVEMPAQFAESRVHNAIIECLSTRGACFFSHIQLAVQGFKSETLDALWDLVWCGVVTNDTFSPVRAILKPSGADIRSAGRRAALSARSHGVARSHAPAVPAEASGRWSLTAEALALQGATPTEQLKAAAQQALARYGIVTRETIQAENASGGAAYALLYPVLKLMEEGGLARRGYFVKDLGPTQFALPGAVDRLRALRDTDSDAMGGTLIGAADPASPYGAALPWPERWVGRKPMRLPGAWCVIVNGELLGWLAPGESELVTFVACENEANTETKAAALANALATSVDGRQRRSLFLEEIDGVRTVPEPLSSALLRAGFQKGASGWMKRPNGL